MNDVCAVSLSLTDNFPDNENDELHLLSSIYGLCAPGDSAGICSASLLKMASRSHLLLSGLLLLFPLLGSSVDNPFSPRASLLRQWKRLFPSEQLPSILLLKASTLNASQVALFSSYISQGSLPSHLPSFCSSANVFCDLEARDVPGDSDFVSYSNKDFRRYQKGTVFGNDNFLNYSVGENVAKDTFLRYGKDGSGTEQFTNYAVDSNVGGSGFSNYDDNSNGGLSTFSSCGKDSNVQGHDFAAYGRSSRGVLDTFSSYSDSSNAIFSRRRCERKTAKRHCIAGDGLRWRRRGRHVGAMEEIFFRPLVRERAGERDI